MDKEYKVGYKLVRKWGCGEGVVLQSWNLSFFRHIARRTYEKDTPTVPLDGCGPLAVFATRTDAQEFHGPDYDTQLWRCDYIPSEDTWLFDGRQYRAHLPPGTILADEVILRERIW